MKSKEKTQRSLNKVSRVGRTGSPFAAAYQHEPLAEYHELDHQLDQLNAVLTSLENRRDLLHQEALKFIQDAKAMRIKNAEGPVAVPESSTESPSKQTEPSEKPGCSD